MSSEWKGLFFFVLVSPSGYSEITYILNELPGLIFFSAFSLLAALWCVPGPLYCHELPIIEITTG